MSDKQDALPIDEPWAPNQGVKRYLYDPFAAERAEMRGSTDRMERVCAWIAGCWPEQTARAIENVTEAQFDDWKVEHRDLYDRAYVLARGMLVAELRASGLGITNRRNQKSMAISVARFMGFKDLTLTQWDSRNKDKGDDEPETDHSLDKLTPEEIDELAALEE